jgi:hypothetical protein
VPDYQNQPPWPEDPHHQWQYATRNPFLEPGQPTFGQSYGQPPRRALYQPANGQAPYGQPQAPYGQPQLQQAAAYQRPPGARRRRHRRRGRRLLLWSLSGFAGFMVLVAVIGALSSSGSKASNASPPAQPTTQQSTAPTPSSSASALVGWYRGTGGDDFRAVQADVSKISSDSNAENAIALAADGATLSSDATVAAGDPPPVDASKYTAAMTEYEDAGQDLAEGTKGGMTNASSALIRGTDNLAVVTAAIAALKA